MFNNRTGAVVSTSTTISNTKRTGTITTNRLRNVIVRTYGVGCVVLTTRAGEMPNVGHLARTEVTWYGIGVYYWRCVVSRGTHVIARHDDEVFDIEWNYYHPGAVDWIPEAHFYELSKCRVMKWSVTVTFQKMAEKFKYHVKDKRFSYPGH